MRQLKEEVDYCMEIDKEYRNSDVRFINKICLEYYSEKIGKLEDGSVAVRLRDLYDLLRWRMMLKESESYLITEDYFCLLIQ